MIMLNLMFRVAGVAALLTGLASAAPADTINLRADNWCPYNCDPRSDRQGLLVDIARAILVPAGHGVDYRIMPWNRALAEVRKGLIQGVIGAQRSEAPDLIYGDVPLAYDDSGFAVKKGTDFRYRGPSSLDPYRIAVIADYNYDGGDEIDAYLKDSAGDKNHIQSNTGDDAGAANLRKLMSGRVDVAMDSAAVLTYLVNQLGLADKVDIVPLGRPTAIYIAFSPAAPRAGEWAALLSSGIETLRQRGELGTILARYGLRDGRMP